MAFQKPTILRHKMSCQRALQFSSKMFVAENVLDIALWGMVQEEMLGVQGQAYCCISRGQNLLRHKAATCPAAP